MLNLVTQENARLMWKKEVAARVDAAIIAMVAGSPLRCHQNCAMAIAWNVYANSGDWRKVVKKPAYWLTKPDPRVSVLPLAMAESISSGPPELDPRVVVLPLAIAQSIAEDSAGHASMRDLCRAIVGDGGYPSDRLAFIFHSALLVGYTIHRPYETSDIRGTRDWLIRATRDYFPEIDPSITENELRKFEPFLLAPGRYVALDDSFQTTAINTLVAIHTLEVPPTWRESDHYQSAVCLVDKFYDVCRQHPTAN